ncbi:MAG: Maf family protein [Chloroflexi bacterium]|nr:Maf family protein [Chloroflexota bacterium]
MRLILASSSPRRRQLLSQMGIDFDIIKPAIDEARREGEAPLDYARRLSREKAEAVAAALDASPALILSADTIVALAADAAGIAEDGELLEKPRDAADAGRMLRALRARAHYVITAITLKRIGPAEQVITRHARTTVYMRDYSDAEIAAYIDSGDPFDKAGAYAIQNEAFHPVARIDGSYSNVVGLPLEEVKAALYEIGFWSMPCN